MKASSVSFPAAVLAVTVGMIWGIVMAISRDHSAMPAHAHLNLLGWVSLFLFGIFYHLHPVIDRSRAALVQVTAWIIGTVVLTIGVGLIHTGHDVGEPFAIRCSQQCCCSAGWCYGGNTPRGHTAHLPSLRNSRYRHFGRKSAPTLLLTNCRV